MLLFVACYYFGFDWMSFNLLFITDDDGMLQNTKHSSTSHFELHFVEFNVYPKLAASASIEFCSHMSITVTLEVTKYDHSLHINIAVLIYFS